jgi:hypothetical protein
LTCTQDGAEEQYADGDSGEELEDTALQDPLSAEEKDDDLSGATDVLLIRRM